MKDSYEYSNSSETGLVIDGERMNTFSYVFVERQIPESVLYKIGLAISNKLKFDDIPECKKPENLYERFTSMFISYWTWRDLILDLADHLNFETQNEDDIANIILLKCIDQNKYCFTYEINGRQYDTSVFKEKPTKIKKASQAEKNDIKLENYSTKSCVVYGNAYELKEELQKMGGKFHSNLHGSEGWLLPISKKDEVANLIINYHLHTV